MEPESLIRHISSIQIRNLSPFPRRDSLASTIKTSSHFTSRTHSSDDLDLAVPKRRPRRVSANSVSTRRSAKGNDQPAVDLVGAASDAAARRTGNFVEGSSIRRSSMSASTLRQQRPRANSMTVSDLSTASILLRDSSQEALESVIASRLVETCLVMTVFFSPSDIGDQVAKPPVLPHNGKERTSNPKGGARRSARFSLSVQENATSRRESTVISRVGSAVKAINHIKSASTPGLRRREEFVAGSSVQSRSNAKSDKDGGLSLFETHVTYISPIHRPSTNPVFSFDTNLLRDRHLAFVGHKFRLEVWGRSDSINNVQNVRDKGKDKQKANNMHPTEWKVIDTWFIDLEKLIPLTENDTESHIYLPPNTPLFTLSPFGRVYYFPSHRDKITRSPSPTPGYSSEPECEAPKAIKKKSLKKNEYDASNHSERPVRMRTSTSQVLSKLAALQSQVKDALLSLFDIQSEIDKELKADVLSSLRREEEERNTIINDLRNSRREVLRVSANLKKQIEQRSNDIRERRQMLSSVQMRYAGMREPRTLRELEIAKERFRLDELRRRFTPTRTALLSTLSTIFPIELCSPPELLYSILDVPLPIPLSANEPAPPLSMPTQKSVTEEAVATALGYVAQVLQLIAAYLGKRLIYPVVCVGSKSLIKDNISAMVGPRMFPLFSKGVDTYRFEYGVFLLNKNIDMLMIDRDLRALDMRHTLPNVKNLMLTLTHGEVAQLQAHTAGSPTNSNEETETLRGRTGEGSTPPASGATTPIASSSAGRPFLGALTGLIRRREGDT
ncbi:hypothetical protein APHAL10511_006190 [Amanita phalloides]|nr:hypothetical protein APHAL10511_006190 [Amanita phalloides]